MLPLNSFMSVWFIEARLMGLNKKNTEVAFLGVFVKFQKVTISFVISVCLSACLCAWNNSPPTGQIFIKVDI